MATSELTVDVELARLTALHLSPASLRFLQAVRDGHADVATGVWSGQLFRAAEVDDAEDLTADGLIGADGLVTGFGEQVLSALPLALDIG